MTSRLSIFNAYNYYFVSGAKRDLTAPEQTFFSFCCDNHDVICNEETESNDPVMVEATRLFDKIT